MTEVRYLPSSELEVRSVGGTPRIAGYAAVFESLSRDLGGFVEQLAPGAFKRVLNSGADVVALYNHDSAAVLGRTSSGTLKLAEDHRGLHYEVEVNTDDPQAISLAAKIARRDVAGSSFSFLIADGGQEWTETDKGYPLRVINQVSTLRELGPTAFPAYEATESNLRSALSSLAEQRSLDVGYLVAAAKQRKLAEALDGEFKPPTAPGRPLEPSDIIDRKLRVYG